MSEPGDVVWADGQAWIRGTTAYGDHKAWWCHPLPVSGEVYRRLSEAEQADDFMWLVKDGIPIVLNALAVYQALDSFADFVAKRDADAELTAERDELRSRLAEMTAQRDRAVAKGSELAAECNDLRGKIDEFETSVDELSNQLVRARHWSDVARVNSGNLDRQLAESDSQLSHALAKVSALMAERDAAEAKGYSHGLLDERAAVVTLLRDRFQYRYAAKMVEEGMHLAASNE